MNTKTSLKVGALAASIALAMASTAAMAATTAPSATQLPGKGAIVSGLGTVSAGTITSGEQTITVTGNGVINWGSGSDINATGTGGFDIGSGAKLHFAGATGTDAVLNIDSSGNVSQIFGVLDDGGTGTQIFVANSNGVIVGAGAQVAGNVSLIANKLATGAADAFDGTLASLTYNGSGGDVTVQKGATLDGTILLSAGGNVNVDLSAFTGGAATLSAGLPSATAGSFASSNTAAAINVAGALPVDGSLAGFSSAGTASNVGVLDLSSVGTYSVGGLFTNTGELTLPQDNGAVHNVGKLTTASGGTFNGGLTNDGAYDAGNAVTVVGGDLVNNGTISNAGSMLAVDGSVTNKGVITDAFELATTSDSGYTAGADYSVTNTGSISAAASAGALVFSANVGSERDAGNDTTGGVSNTGTLTAGGMGLIASAYNDVSFGGTLKQSGKVVSDTNPLGLFEATSANGVVTLSTPVASSGVALFEGAQVKLLADVDAGQVVVLGGDKLASDYAIRVGSGVTVSGEQIFMLGDSSAGTPTHPNVILQGTVSGNQITFGSTDSDYAVSDVLAGPNGSIMATGAKPYVEFDFTGKLKTAPYLNDANFRYNDLPITVTDDTSLALELNPVAYQTNATADSAVNILVNGGVLLGSGQTAPNAALQSSAVTGVNNFGNAHLVLQSTGNIQVNGDDSGTFYWPGMVYLGNIATNADGSAAPGTLGYGTIALNGNFNNVLPGDVAGGAGIHFITQYPLEMNGFSVTTNANSWINFGTDSLTAAYTTGAQGAGFFYGGAQGSGNVVNYGDFDPSLFHTQAPSSAK